MPMPMSIFSWSTCEGGAAVEAGAKSTMRKMVPLAGGGTPALASALSAAPPRSTGNSLVIHRFATALPPGLRCLGATSPSINATALPCGSWPTTTRLTGLNSNFSSCDRIGCGSALRDDRQQEMRWALGVVKDLVQRRAAGDDVVGHVFGVGRTGDAGRHVGARDLDADAMAAAEQVGGRQDIDRVFGDLARCHLLLRLAGQRMPRPPRLRPLGVERAMRCLQPAARQLAFAQVARQIALALAHRTHGYIRADILERDEPVGVVLVD